MRKCWAFLLPEDWTRRWHISVGFNHSIWCVCVCVFFQWPHEYWWLCNQKNYVCLVSLKHKRWLHEDIPDDISHITGKCTHCSENVWLYSMMLIWIVLSRYHCSGFASLAPVRHNVFVDALYRCSGWLDLRWHLGSFTGGKHCPLTQAGFIWLVNHGSPGPSVAHDSDYMWKHMFGTVQNKLTLVCAPINSCCNLLGH